MAQKCISSPKWIAYRHGPGETGVVRYRSGPDFIDVQFKKGGVYRYDPSCPGWEHVAAMKKLALTGKGLTTYINQHVQDRYAKKL